MSNKDIFNLTLAYYDEKVVDLIIEYYGIKGIDAIRKFINSKTYEMLSDERLEMWDFSPYGIFDMYKEEQISGDPRNSLYIRRD